MGRTPVGRVLGRDAGEEIDFWLKRAQEIDYDTDYADEEDDEDEVVEEDDEDEIPEEADDD